MDSPFLKLLRYRDARSGGSRPFQGRKIRRVKIRCLFGLGIEPQAGRDPLCRDLHDALPFVFLDSVTQSTEPAAHAAFVSASG
jgi:hypothetical protein